MNLSAIIPAVEADGLVKTFGGQRAVDGVSLTVPTGSVYGVLGPNGAGKTTTIRILTITGHVAEDDSERNVA